MPNIKTINDVFQNPDFIIQFLSLLNQYELINDVALRNAIIKKEWLESKSKNESHKSFLERTAAKYFISEKSIESILYRPKSLNAKRLYPRIKEIMNTEQNKQSIHSPE